MNYLHSKQQNKLSKLISKNAVFVLKKLNLLTLSKDQHCDFFPIHKKDDHFSIAWYNSKDLAEVIYYPTP
jgi:hypothetical protein